MTASHRPTRLRILPDFSIADFVTMQQLHQQGTITPLIGGRHTMRANTKEPSTTSVRKVRETSPDPAKERARENGGNHDGGPFSDKETQTPLVAEPSNLMDNPPERPPKVSDNGDVGNDGNGGHAATPHPLPPIPRNGMVQPPLRGSSITNKPSTGAGPDFIVTETTSGGSKANKRKNAEADRAEQITVLGNKVETLSRDKEILEDQLNRALEHLEEANKARNVNVTDLDKKLVEMTVTIEELGAENERLRERVKDTEAHIFSLQPYTKDLKPDDVGKLYDELVDSVEQCVENTMNTYLMNPHRGTETVLNAAKKRPEEGAKFRSILHSHTDLVNACRYHDTDEDIMLAVILRYLLKEVFQKTLYGAAYNFTAVIGVLESSMQTEVKPERDLYTTRTWTAEAYNAMISTREFDEHRRQRQGELATELAYSLRIFNPGKMRAFAQDLETLCVAPAIKLHEQMMTSTDHYYLDNAPYMAQERDGHIIQFPDFLDRLEDLDCRNLLQHRKAFVPSKLSPPPTRSELKYRLENVCSVVPSLNVRQIGQRDSMKESIVRKQRTLVLYGPNEDRDKYKMGELPIMHYVYHGDYAQPKRSLVSNLPGSWR